MLIKSSLAIRKINRTIKIVMLIAVFFGVKTYGQITLSASEIQFGKVPVKTLSVRNIVVKHGFSDQKEIEIIFSANAGFTVSPSEFLLSPSDSQIVSISFSPAENIRYRNVLMVRESFSGAAAYLKLTGDGSIETLYEATTFDKWDAELKTALTALVSNHTSLGYNTGRDRMFENVDLQPGDTIECVYTGKKIKAATRTIAQNLGFNTEHTWPQSFFSENEPMRSDIFHLYPTDATPNSMRANYDFGIVVSGITWQVGGSKLGRNYLNQLIFEPRDVHKGDVARSLFYFVTRYTDLGGYLDTLQQSVLRLWNRFDTVSSREYARNGKIAQYQGKRNPYIDHPEFVDRIYSFTGSATTPKFPKAVLSTDTLRLRYEGAMPAGDSSYISLYLGNTSRGDLSYSTSFQNTDVFKVHRGNASLPYGAVDSIIVVFSPQAAGDFSTELLINTNDGLKRLPIFGTAVAGDTREITKLPEDFGIAGNYPNPFNSSTIIEYKVDKRQHISLEIYSISGELVARVFDKEVEAGKHSQQINIPGFTSGIYYAVLTGISGVSVYPLHYLK